MDCEDGFVERRRHKRFKAKSGALAAIYTTASKYFCVGEILNINRCGLSFRYATKNDEPEESFRLDILFAKDIVCLNYVMNIPVETVWISRAVTDRESGILNAKHRGVQFKELTPQQERQLDYFIHKYAIT